MDENRKNFKISNFSFNLEEKYLKHILKNNTVDTPQIDKYILL